MPILEKTIRIAAITIAVLFIVVSLFGIFGAWFVDRKATDVVLKGFGLIETGVGVVDAGVGRVNDLIATSRMEVRQASETLTAVGTQAQANRPVLNALNDTAGDGIVTDNLFSSTFAQPTVFMDPRRAMISVRLDLGR